MNWNRTGSEKRKAPDKDLYISTSSRRAYSFRRILVLIWVAFSPQTTPAVLIPRTLLHKQTGKMWGYCKMVRTIPMSRRMTKLAKEMAR
jgi:hypothetical protein